MVFRLFMRTELIGRTCNSAEYTAVFIDTISYYHSVFELISTYGQTSTSMVENSSVSLRNMLRT